jgi:hypothetical protein
MHSNDGFQCEWPGGLPIMSPQPARVAQYSQARQVVGELGM